MNIKKTVSKAQTFFSMPTYTYKRDTEKRLGLLLGSPRYVSGFRIFVDGNPCGDFPPLIIESEQNNESAIKEMCDYLTAGGITDPAVWPSVTFSRS